MKKEHVRIINIGAIGIILGVCLSALLVSIFGTDSAQDGAEPQPETQVETQVEHEPEAEEVSNDRLEDSEYVKSMSEQDQAYLLAIICLAVEDGHSPSEVAETIAENFDEISEDYAQRFVSAALITVCSKTSE